MDGGLVQRLLFNQKTAWPPLALTFLLILLLLLSKSACADDPTAPRPRFGQMLGYLRQQAPNLLPGLPAALTRDPAAWAQNRLNATEAALGLGDTTADGKPGEDNGFFQPLATLIAAPKPEDEQALWLSPAYHHKGMLPFHDALMLGFGMRESFLDRRLSFDLQPSYGQNWVSAQGYWGTQLSASFGPGGTAKPWARLSLGFTDGDSSLMDHGHGFSLHSEWNLGDRFTLNAGVRSSDAVRSDNFVMMRWNLLGE